MFTPMIILALAALLLVAADHFAQARLERPLAGGALPAVAARARWQDAGAQVDGSLVEPQPGPPPRSMDSGVTIRARRTAAAPQ